jgi:hypothetical protein
MPVLNNQKHEIFAQMMAAGKDRPFAVTLAGYSPRGADNQAYRLLQIDDVQSRIKELQEQSARATVMSTIERKELLSLIARVNVTDMWEVTEDGISLRYGTIPAWLAPAVQEVKFESWSGGKNKRAQGSRLTIKLYDKLKAVEILNSMTGDNALPQNLMNLLSDLRGARQPQLLEGKVIDEDSSHNESNNLPVGDKESGDIT